VLARKGPLRRAEAARPCALRAVLSGWFRDGRLRRDELRSFSLRPKTRKQNRRESVYTDSLTPPGRRVLEVLRGIQMGTICLRRADGMKLELERVSTLRPEEALVLHSLNVALPRPRVRLDGIDLTLPEERTLLDPVDDCSDKK